MHTTISHTQLAYSSQTFRRALYCKNNNILPEMIVREILWVEANYYVRVVNILKFIYLWVEANKPVSGKHKDPILTCLLCEQPCHANIWHHHLSCMNTALAKVCFDTVKILEGIAKELLSTMKIKIKTNC